MDPSNETSILRVQFGDSFETGQIFVNTKIQINQNAAMEQETMLNQVTGNTIDVANCAVIALNCKPQNLNALTEKIRNFVEEYPAQEGPTTMLHTLFCQNVKPKVSVKYTQADNRVFISINSPMMEEGLAGVIGMAQIASPIINETYNSIEVTLAMNQSVDQFLEKVNSGQRIGSALLSNAQIQLKASLNKNLGEKALQVASMIDPNIANFPPLQLVGAIGNVEMDFQFQSTSELPTNLQNQALPGQFADIPEEQRAIPPEFDSFVTSLMEYVESDLEIYFTLSQILAAQVTFKAPDVTKFAKVYLGHLLN